jgi:hypothetical protein
MIVAKGETPMIEPFGGGALVDFAGMRKLMGLIPDRKYYDYVVHDPRFKVDILGGNGNKGIFSRVRILEYLETIARDGFPPEILEQIEENRKKKERTRASPVAPIHKLSDTGEPLRRPGRPRKVTTDSVLVALHDLKDATAHDIERIAAALSKKAAQAFKNEERVAEAA